MTKVEQCGTGYETTSGAEDQKTDDDIYIVLRCARFLTRSTVSTPRACYVARMKDTKTCIVDIPMGRVKFNVNTEYAYIQNFKILQSKGNQTHNGNGNTPDVGLL